MVQLTLLVLAATFVASSSFTPRVFSRRRSSPLFEGGSMKVADAGVVDANVYNVNLEKAAATLTASVQVEKSAVRAPGVPFLDSKSKDYFVDDETFLVSRDGGLGLELLELAGGRDDGFGITIVENVVKGSNAEKAGILAGDSISSVGIPSPSFVFGSGEILADVRDCECRDFDATIAVLSSIPEDVDSIVVNLKRVRRWPKIQLRVEYPPSQCAEGVSNVKDIELFAGENLQRAMLNRGIILDDPGQGKCDFCGKNSCVVSVYGGRKLLNPMGLTEEKLMERNPRCRLSCKTTVGFNMAEGDVNVRVNLSQWSSKEEK